MNRENSANTDLEFHVHDTREWLASYNLDSFTAQSVQLVVVRAGLQERTLSELQQSSNMHTTLSTGVLCVCVCASYCINTEKIVSHYSIFLQTSVFCSITIPSPSVV